MDSRLDCRVMPELLSQRVAALMAAWHAPCNIKIRRVFVSVMRSVSYGSTASVARERTPHGTLSEREPPRETICHYKYTQAHINVIPTTNWPDHHILLPPSQPAKSRQVSHTSQQRFDEIVVPHNSSVARIERLQ